MKWLRLSLSLAQFTVSRLSRAVAVRAKKTLQDFAGRGSR